MLASMFQFPPSNVSISLNQPCLTFLAGNTKILLDSDDELDADEEENNMFHQYNPIFKDKHGFVRNESIKNL